MLILVLVVHSILSWRAEQVEDPGAGTKDSGGDEQGLAGTKLAGVADGLVPTAAP